MSETGIVPMDLLFESTSTTVATTVTFHFISCFRDTCSVTRGRYSKGKGKVTPLEARCGPEGG